MKQAVCRTQKEYDLYYMLIKDVSEVVPMVKAVDKVIGIPTDEQYEDLMNLLQKALNNKVDAKEISNNIDLDLAKKIIIYYIGGNKDVDKITSGKTIVDRLGNEHKVYSVALNKRTIGKVRELLPKIDPLVTVNNILDIDDKGEFAQDAYKALLELIKMALADEKLTSKQLEKFLDVAFAKNVIRIYLDLPLVG